MKHTHLKPSQNVVRKIIVKYTEYNIDQSSKQQNPAGVRIGIFIGATTSACLKKNKQMNK